MAGLPSVRIKPSPWLIIVTLTVALIAAWFALEIPGVPEKLSRLRPSAQLPHLQTFTEPPSHSFESLIRAVYSPLHPLGASSFHDYEGTEWRLPGGGLRWTKPLKKRLCIVDIDTRKLDNKDQIRDTHPLFWNNTDPTAAGMLNHYMYAAVHGYDYHFVRADRIPDRAPYWSKPAALSRILRNYDICVSIDADAIFTHLHLPFEWLLNRWGVEPGATALTMALDPDKPFNQDSRGRIATNAGFVIAQNIPRAHAMLADWAACPDLPDKYPNCSQWKQPWPAEQRAFADYIRYEYNNEHDVLEVPCDEANGYPESGSGCMGRFLRHYWRHKAELLKPNVAVTLAQAVAGKAHRDFLAQKDVVVYDKVPAPSRHMEKERSRQA